MWVSRKRLQEMLAAERHKGWVDGLCFGFALGAGAADPLNQFLRRLGLKADKGKGGPERAKPSEGWCRGTGGKGGKKP